MRKKTGQKHDRLAWGSWLAKGCISQDGQDDDLDLPRKEVAEIIVSYSYRFSHYVIPSLKTCDPYGHIPPNYKSGKPRSELIAQTGCI
jgi:hypothetical protein